MNAEEASTTVVSNRLNPDLEPYLKSLEQKDAPQWFSLSPKFGYFKKRKL
jgi:hypothetical protein